MAVDPITGEERVETPVEETPVETTTEEPTSSAPENTLVDQAVKGYTDAGANALAGDSGSYAEYDNPELDLAAITKPTGETYMTPATKVASQLEALLDKDSGLSQQARRQSREGASALGMMSSSAAIGDTRAKQISALVPVASKDAEIAAGFKSNEQLLNNEIAKIQTEATVSGSLTQQKADIAEQQTRINQNWESIMKGLDTKQGEAMTTLKADLDIRMKELEADITRELQQQEIDANIEQTIIAQANESMNNYQISVQSLLANESFLDNFAGNDAAMKGFFDDLFVTVESSLEYQAKAAGVYWNETTQTGLKTFIEQLALDNAWSSGTTTV